MPLSHPRVHVACLGAFTPDRERGGVFRYIEESQRGAVTGLLRAPALLLVGLLALSVRGGEQMRHHTHSNHSMHGNKNEGGIEAQK